MRNYPNSLSQLNRSTLVPLIICYLPTKAKKSQVIIVRFANRCVKDMVYDHRYLLPSKLSITEHMTDTNISIINHARKLFGYNFVRTKDCKIKIELFGRDHNVSSFLDVNNLFACYCEFLGTNDDILPSIPTKHVVKSRLPTRPSAVSYSAMVQRNPKGTVNRFDKVNSQTFYRGRK